jgi:carbon catabolite-derepressing protein kinase
MDLQLYKVDSANYLVDFRNIGYYRASSGTALNPDDIKSVDLTEAHAGENGERAEGIATSPPAATSAATTGGAHSKPSTSSGGATDAAAGLIGGVSGPFHFLEMACQLIAELASG